MIEAHDTLSLGLFQEKNNMIKKKALEEGDHGDRLETNNVASMACLFHNKVTVSA